jgi:hypothetical protein
MLFLGVLSVFQLLFFPGLLIIRLFPGKRTFIQNFVYIFMLSLLANYAAVFILVGVGLYLRSVVLVLFTFELAGLVWIYRRPLLLTGRAKRKKVQDTILQSFKSFRSWWEKDPWSAGLYLVFGTLAVLGVVWVLWVWVSNFNTVYQTWDAWASWDRWAVKWSENEFPNDTWEYPQLIPSIYSVAYKFIGTTAVKFFGKSIMPLFALVIGLMLIDLGKKFRSFGYMLGAGLALYSLNLFLGKYLPEGYVDIPVACFSLMAIYTLLWAQTASQKQEIRSALLLGSLSTAAAAVTKQTGLYIFAFYPIFAYFWILRGNKSFKRREALLLLGKHFLLAFVFVAPWYIFTEYQINFGSNSSNIQYVISDIYAGQSLWDRFVSATGAMGNYVYLYVFALISLFVLDNRFRTLVLLLIFPFSFLWAFFLSYEMRNLAIALPLLSVTVGVAVEGWISRPPEFFIAPSQKISRWLSVQFTGIGKIRVPLLVTFLLSAVVLGLSTFVFTDKQIADRQIEQQRHIIEPTLNDKLYRYFSHAGGPQPVITDYPINWLPGLEKMRRYDSFQNLDAYHQTLLRYPDVELLLLPVLTSDQLILEEVQSSIDTGTYQVIFTEANYQLIHIPPR